MTKLDGSLHYRGEVTPLMEVFLRRRSVRKYAKGEASADQVEAIEEAISTFLTRCNFEAPRVIIVPRGPDFDAIRKAAFSGIVGKINPWFPRCPASHLLICSAVYPDGDDSPARDARDAAIKQAAMAMQVAILAAAEQSLGTCWMAGVNIDAIEKAYAPLDGAQLMAISPLGVPARPKGLSWDAMSYHLISKRRKKLDAIVMDERWSEGG